MGSHSTWFLFDCLWYLDTRGSLSPSLRTFGFDRSSFAFTTTTCQVVVGLSEDGMPSKSGEFDECVFADTSERSDVNQILAWLKSYCLSPTTSIFHPLTLAQYEDQIKKAACLVKLGSLRLTPHMLRHSGASHDAFYSIRSIREIQVRGRWKAAASVARYKKPGRMLLSQAEVSKSVWREADLARPKVLSSLSHYFKSK